MDSVCLRIEGHLKLNHFQCYVRRGYFDVPKVPNWANTCEYAVLQISEPIQTSVTDRGETELSEQFLLLLNSLSPEPLTVLLQKVERSLSKLQEGILEKGSQQGFSIYRKMGDDQYQ